MSRTSLPAPADRYNPLKTEVTNLGVRLTALRRAMPPAASHRCRRAASQESLRRTFSLSRTGTPGRMFLSRIAEVGWGVCAAVGTVRVTARGTELDRE